MEKQKPLTVASRLIGKKSLTGDVVEFLFQAEPAFSFQPGQFISIVIPGAGPGGRDLRRAYSIASSPELDLDGKPVFELCVKLVEGGPGTTYLNSLNIGQSMTGMAPFGDFVFKPNPDRHALFISTGTGLAPFRSMALSRVFSENRPRSTRILFGARNEGDLLYTEELLAVLGPGSLVQALSRSQADWCGFKGRVTDWLRENAAAIDWANTEFYLCGNGAMIDEAKTILTSKGVEKTSIHQEVYYKPKPGESHAN
ncbi:MAG: FAD-dependent oxidoreductase [Bdellovibrionales bacterium]|nr:FAD-dependent oxidoreductase [Bdellovibrionales bacterium]